MSEDLRQLIEEDLAMASTSGADLRDPGALVQYHLQRALVRAILHLSDVTEEGNRGLIPHWSEDEHVPLPDDYEGPWSMKQTDSGDGVVFGSTPEGAAEYDANHTTVTDAVDLGPDGPTSTIINERPSPTMTIIRDMPPALTEKDNPLLAKVWDNPEDRAAYDDEEPRRPSPFEKPPENSESTDVQTEQG